LGYSCALEPASSDLLKFTTDFKVEAVEMVIESCRPVAEVARKFR